MRNIVTVNNIAYDYKTKSVINTLMVIIVNGVQFSILLLFIVIICRCLFLCFYPTWTTISIVIFKMHIVFYYLWCNNVSNYVQFGEYIFDYSSTYYTMMSMYIHIHTLGSAKIWFLISTTQYHHVWIKKKLKNHFGVFLLSKWAKRGKAECAW